MTPTDDKYCYPNTSILINKLGYKELPSLIDIEIKLTLARLGHLQLRPIKGNLDFAHLKSIHRYIFQDIYEWAGEVRTVEIGKGNLFCTVACIQSYAKALFDKYYQQCYDSKNNKVSFIEALAKNYGDLNALHPFREGNGRAQREFARIVCLECGYGFDLSCTTHKKMLEASVNNFNTGNISGFVSIFSDAVYSINELPQQTNSLYILTSDDLESDNTNGAYYGYGQYNSSNNKYNNYFNDKITNMIEEYKSHDDKTINENSCVENYSIEVKDINEGSSNTIYKRPI